MEMAVTCRRRTIGLRRFDVSIDVHVCGRNAEGTAFEGLGVIRNLSMRGALMESHLCLTTGDRVTLSVTLPNQPDPVAITGATVRWTHGGQVGVEFLKLNPHTSRRLMVFLGGIHGAARFPPKP